MSPLRSLNTENLIRGAAISANIPIPELDPRIQLKLGAVFYRARLCIEGFNAGKHDTELNIKMEQLAMSLQIAMADSHSCIVRALDPVRYGGKGSLDVTDAQILQLLPEIHTFLIDLFRNQNVHRHYLSLLKKQRPKATVENDDQTIADILEHSANDAIDVHEDVAACEKRVDAALELLRPNEESQSWLSRAMAFFQARRRQYVQKLEAWKLKLTQFPSAITKTHNAWKETLEHECCNPDEVPLYLEKVSLSYNTHFLVPIHNIETELREIEAYAGLAKHAPN